MEASALAKGAARAYVAAINEKDLAALLALFREDGELVHPFGTFTGRAKLEEFYGGIVMHADTALTAGKLVGEDNVAVIEVTGVSPQAPDNPQYALDMFEVDAEGKIIRLSIYYLNSAG
jgi:ketosteroid isomerase-like protein